MKNYTLDRINAICDDRNPIKKAMGYAYSSSDNAKDLGFSKSGCFYVEVFFNNEVKHMKGFKDRRDAQECLGSIDAPICSYCLSQMPVATNDH